MPHQTTGFLLDEITKMRAVMERKEMREGVKLAVQLSSLLQRVASQAPTASPRPDRPTPCDGLRTGAAPCLFVETPYKARFRSIPAGS